MGGWWSGGTPMLTPEQIRKNLEAVERRIVAACDRASRRREEVTLVAVTKTFPGEAVSAAIAAGVANVGENRVQEARDKKPRVEGSARWHLIGHLQSNKARDAVRLFDVIQTVDSVALGTRIGRFAEAEGKTQNALVEVNIGREEQKSGADPDQVEEITRELKKVRSLSILGLMAIPPAGDPETLRPHFRELCRMQKKLALPHLSMGMTDDFDVAIEEGATIIRVGRAIFGERG
jgi:pyridoxal phosphate enzyme (YggS family)